MAEVNKDAQTSTPDDEALIAEAEKIVADAGKVPATVSNGAETDDEEVLTAEVVEDTPDAQSEGDAQGNDSAEPNAEDAEDAEPNADAVMAAAAAELKAARAQAADWQDKYMRLSAEWDTYRRRTNEARAEERVRACEKLVENLLPVVDDFERTIDYAEKNGEAELLGGVKAVHHKFVGVLEKSGVVVINPAGEAFDALEAQAVATVEKPDVYDETVDQVYQKGYKMGNKVLRSAMVTVTTGGAKRPPKEDEQ